MSLTVVSVSYSLASIGPDAVGGAEQILSALDHALVASGHNSLVVASEGSQVAGTLIATPPIPAAITDAARRRAEAATRDAVAGALRRGMVDLVHMHGVDFAACLPQRGPPILVTLHLPPAFHPSGSFGDAGAGVFYNCVSAAQRRSFPSLPGMLPEIDNGVPVDRLQQTDGGSSVIAERSRHSLSPSFLRMRESRDTRGGDPGSALRPGRDDSESCAAAAPTSGFALALGRICPEKGFHHALDAAARAAVPLWIGGRVFGYETHQRYFAEQIEPRLVAGSRFLGPVGFDDKRRLLTRARCLLVPSLAAETSSLVAMEAMACGTPVIAFSAGALADIVEPGITGFLVADAAEMAAAICVADTLDRAQIRAVARRRFSQDRMTAAYLDLYRRLVGR